MPSRILALMLLVALSAMPSLSQGRGGGPGPSRSGMQGAGASQAGRGAQAGNRHQTQQRTQAQQRVQATDRQRQQYQDCLQSTSRLRTRLREMSRLGKGQAVSPEQAARWREQLRNQVLTMQQQHERLLAGLTEQQQTAAGDSLGQFQRTQQQMEVFSEALGFELEQAELDTARIREKARDADGALKTLEQQQRDLGSDLGIQL